MLGERAFELRFPCDGLEEGVAEGAVVFDAAPGVGAGSGACGIFRAQFATTFDVKLTPLPGLLHLTEDQR